MGHGRDIPNHTVYDYFTIKRRYNSHICLTHQCKIRQDLQRYNASATSSPDLHRHIYTSRQTGTIEGRRFQGVRQKMTNREQRSCKLLLKLLNSLDLWRPSSDVCTRQKHLNILNIAAVCTTLLLLMMIYQLKGKLFN